MLKRKRQELILSAIEHGVISTQDELLAALREHDLDVTQATISRDIKELGIVKAMTGDGKYRYTAPRETGGSGSSVGSILTHSVRSTDSAVNTVVVKCFAGMAQAACAAIDSLGLPEIVGTIAGDDTIFILCRTEESARALAKRFSEYV